MATDKSIGIPARMGGLINRDEAIAPSQKDD
jgi:hypothetical protein